MVQKFRNFLKFMQQVSGRTQELRLSVLCFRHVKHLPSVWFQGCCISNCKGYIYVWYGNHEPQVKSCLRSSACPSSVDRCIHSFYVLYFVYWVDHIQGCPRTHFYMNIMYCRKCAFALLHICLILFSLRAEILEICYYRRVGEYLAVTRFLFDIKTFMINSSMNQGIVMSGLYVFGGGAHIITFHNLCWIIFYTFYMNVCI